MKKLQQEGRNLEPNTVTYTTILNTLARSKTPNKALLAREMLAEMDESYRSGNRNLRPNSFAYNAVINACAFTAGTPDKRRKALELALVTLEELERSNYGKPNNITYSIVLQACKNLSKTAQEIKRVQRVVLEIFLRSCRDGQVDEFLLRRFIEVADAQTRAKALGQYQTINDLPMDWICNVINKKRSKAFSHRDL